MPKEEKSAINSKNAVDIIEQSNYQFRQWNEASKNVADYNNPDAVKPPSRTGSFVPPVMSALNGMSVRKSGMTNPV